MAHKQCIDKLNKKCDCIKDDLDELQKIKRNLIREIKYRFFYSWWNYLDMLPSRIYWFFQRGYRGFGDNDLWDFDSYLSTMIPQALKELKKCQHGLPTWTKKKSELQAKKEWNIILNKIILSFELAQKYINLDINPEEWKIKYKKQFKEGMNLFGDWFFALWD